MIVLVGCLTPPPFPASLCRPWLLSDPPTPHLIQIPSQKSKDKGVHQQHQQHLSHGRIVNGLVDVGPSYSWNKKQHIRFEGVGDISYFIEGINFQTKMTWDTLHHSTMWHSCYQRMAWVFTGIHSSSSKIRHYREVITSDSGLKWSRRVHPN